MNKILLRMLLSLLWTVNCYADSSGSNTSVSRAQYMANEGLMVVQGDTKVVFDPLFRNSYGQYQLLPKEMEDALFSGQPPFDGIDAVFVSHYHCVGVHVPVSIPKNPSLRPQELRDVDLFTEPGESRDILSVTPRVEKN